MLVSIIFFIVVVTNLTGDVLSSSSIYLSWDLPNLPGLSKELEYYIVHCIEVQSNGEWTFFAVKPHATIISLLPYNDYKCQVAIVGNVTYQYSHNISLMTLQEGMTCIPMLSLQACKRGCMTGQ